MTPSLRKLALTAHIVFSVGWLGAIVPYLALAIAGLTSRDAQTARAAYLSMELIGWAVIVPLSLAALASGIFQSLATPWGSLRHWWIIAKLLLTTAATVILLTHMQAVSRMAQIAASTTWEAAGFRELRVQHLLHAAGGLAVLLAITAISVFKQWGLTPLGRRRVPQLDMAPPQEIAAPAFATSAPRWMRIVGFHAIALFLIFVVLHIAGGGMSHHGH